MEKFIERRRLGGTISLRPLRGASGDMSHLLLRSCRRDGNVMDPPLSHHRVIGDEKEVFVTEVL